MTAGIPTVSMGLPIFNGEQYLSATLDGLLAQTYGDFEMVISDNASTDSTAAICADYSRCDKRIRYYRNKPNIGAARNFNRAFEHSRGSISRGLPMTMCTKAAFWRSASKLSKMTRTSC